MPLTTKPFRKVRPSPKQDAIVAARRADPAGSLRVLAFADTGKTTALQLLAEADPTPGLYPAYTLGMLLPTGDLVDRVANPPRGSSSNWNRRPHVLQCSMVVVLGSHAVGEVAATRIVGSGRDAQGLSQTFSLPDQLAGPRARPFFQAGAYAGHAPPARAIGGNGRGATAIGRGG
jgi:hypothetical protein